MFYRLFQQVTVTFMSEFTDWLAKTGRARGLDTEASISRAISTDQSIVGRWRTQDKIPDITTQRRIAEGLGVPIQEVLVATGYVKPDEVGMVQVRQRLDELSNEDLLAEVARRMINPAAREEVLTRSADLAGPSRRGLRPGGA